MSEVQDLAQLGKLIAVNHGWPTAKAFKAYVASDEDKAAVATKARDVLRVFPEAAGACALMSAAFAVHLERELDAPIHVVAGTLTIDGEPVIGDRQPFDGRVIFGADEFAWDGHVWVMIGPYIADLSIFRTAYSPVSPPNLTRHIAHVFGAGKGLYFDRWRHTRQLGLGYHPQYVLSEAEVTALLAGAQRAIEQGPAIRRS